MARARQRDFHTVEVLRHPYAMGAPLTSRSYQRDCLAAEIAAMQGPRRIGGHSFIGEHHIELVLHKPCDEPFKQARLQRQHNRRIGQHRANPILLVVARKCRNAADAQARDALALSMQATQHFLAQPENILGVRQDQLSGIGQHQTPAFTNKQGVIKPFFELANLCRDGGLGGMQFFRRTRQVSQFCDAPEVKQVVEVQPFYCNHSFL